MYFMHGLNSTYVSSQSLNSSESISKVPIVLLSQDLKLEDMSKQEDMEIAPHVPHSQSLNQC